LTSVKQQATVSEMKIGRIVHRGLRQLYEQDSVKGIPAGTADKLRKMLAFLEGMDDAEELHGLPIWKAHLLGGDRQGTWSLNVTRNWRLTFWIDTDEKLICDLNLEDYH
jgi:proteic killer suppression protein